MKTLKHICILLSIAAGLALQFQSCKKDKETSNEPANEPNWGYVKEYYTEKPIPNAMVVVYGKNPRWAAQDTLYTDSNGRYEFQYVEYLAELQATSLGYIPNRMFTQDELVGRFNRTIYLYQPAEMILHVKNVKPFDEYDRISLNDFFAPDVIIYGNEVDTLICCLISRRYQEVGLKTVIWKNAKDSIAIYKYTPTRSTGNTVEINY
jgi:hypothetical protein